jgi:hypothetical protein
MILALFLASAISPMGIRAHGRGFIRQARIRNRIKPRVTPEHANHNCLKKKGRDVL